MRSPSCVIGFDDAPFRREHRGDVAVVGAVFNGPRLEGVMIGKVRRDGANASRRLAELVNRSRFRPSLQAILLQGVTLAGFNVVDLPELHAKTQLPVIAVMRRRPDLTRIKRALLGSVPGGKRKWRLIERLGEVELVGSVYVQRLGISAKRTAGLIERFAINSALPEPLRTAHLIAGSLADGESRHRP